MPTCQGPICAPRDARNLRLFAGYDVRLLVEMKLGLRVQTKNVSYFEAACAMVTSVAANTHFGNNRRTMVLG
jgi:hypothetical protein